MPDHYYDYDKYSAMEQTPWRFFRGFLFGFLYGFRLVFFMVFC
jgi:hypothetical protein